jgi:hypothetical protein
MFLSGDFSTLCSGGTLVMIDEHERRDEGTLRVLKKERSKECSCRLSLWSWQRREHGAAVESLG